MSRRAVGFTVARVANLVTVAGAIRAWLDVARPLWRAMRKLSRQIGAARAAIAVALDGVEQWREQQSLAGIFAAVGEARGHARDAIAAYESPAKTVGEVVALTPTLQHEFRENRPSSAEWKLCTLTLIVQHIWRKFDPYLRHNC